MSIGFSLLKNAVDYMERAINSYFEKDYKSGLNNLWSSLLLFFKYKLFLIHPAFIFSDVMDCVAIEGDYYISEKMLKRITDSRQFSRKEINEITLYQDKYFQERELLIDIIKSNTSLSEQKINIIKKSISIIRKDVHFVEPSIETNFKTITYQEIGDRLIKLGEKDSLFFEYKKEFDQLQQLRNRVEHFIHDFHENNFLLIFHSVMPFINDFIEYELEENAEELFSNWGKFIEIDSLAKSRLETVKKFIRENSPNYRDIAHGEDYPLTCDCPNCGNTMIQRNEKMFCKFCGNEENYSICMDCNEVFPENGFETYIDDLQLCKECYLYRVNKIE